MNAVSEEVALGPLDYIPASKGTTLPLRGWESRRCLTSYHSIAWQVNECRARRAHARTTMDFSNRVVTKDGLFFRDDNASLQTTCDPATPDTQRRR